MSEDVTSSLRHLMTTTSTSLSFPASIYNSMSQLSQLTESKTKVAHLALNDVRRNLPGIYVNNPLRRDKNQLQCPPLIRSRQTVVQESQED